MLQVVNTQIVDGVLTLTCEGVFRVGSLGNPSGLPIKDRIRTALYEAQVARVVINFRNVDYEWGDGPGWSILDALWRRIPVTYVCSPQNITALDELFETSGLRSFAEIKTVLSTEQPDT